MGVYPLALCLLLGPICAAAVERRPPLAAPAVTNTHNRPPWPHLSAVQQHELPPINSSSTVEGGIAATRNLEDLSDMLTLSKPFIAHSAIVRGPVSAELQAELEAEEALQPHSSSSAGAFRALLHGTKKPKKYPKCGECRMVRCARRRTYCSGHCRQRKKLFFCDTNSLPAFDCRPPEPGEEPTIEDFIDRGPSYIEDYDTVVVTAEAPYIGCANIANRPTGCPARGTRGTLPDGRQVLVAATSCRAEYYVPDCLSPLLPYGACECTYREVRRRGFSSFFRSRRTIRAPCSTMVLAAGSGVGGADGSPSGDGIVVQPRGEVTETWFSNFTEPGQMPDYRYTMAVSVRSTAVDVSLSVFEALVLFSDSLQAGSEISDDYSDDYTSDSEGSVYDYDPELIERDYDYDSVTEGNRPSEGSRSSEGSGFSEGNSPSEGSSVSEGNRLSEGSSASEGISA